MQRSCGQSLPTKREHADKFEADVHFYLQTFGASYSPPPGALPGDVPRLPSPPAGSGGVLFTRPLGELLPELVPAFPPRCIGSWVTEGAAFGCCADGVVVGDDCPVDEPLEPEPLPL